MIPTFVLKLILIPVVLTTGFHLVALFWYPADVAFVMVMGGSEFCTWEQAMEGRRLLEERQQRPADPARESRLIRSEGDFEVWQTPMGERWAPKGFHFGLGAGTPRWQVVERVEPPIEPGDVVLDCGGHVGHSAYTALEMGAGLVVSFEPDPINAECIEVMGYLVDSSRHYILGVGVPAQVASTIVL